MTFTPEEIKEGEELIKQFDDLVRTWDCYNDVPVYENNNVKCAIIAQKMKVEAINQLYEMCKELTHAKRVLQYLESL